MSTGAAFAGPPPLPPPPPPGYPGPYVYPQDSPSATGEAIELFYRLSLDEVQKGIRWLQRQRADYPNRDNSLALLRTREKQLLDPTGLQVDPVLARQSFEKMIKDKTPSIVARESQALRDTLKSIWASTLEDTYVGDLAEAVTEGLPLSKTVGTWPARVLNFIFPVNNANSGGDVLTLDQLQRNRGETFNPDILWLAVFFDWLNKGVFVAPQWFTDP